MLKMYQSQSVHTGNSPDFWEENWAEGEFEESVRFMAVDPLRPLFEEFLRPGALMLEGGCGMGNYAAYYAARGYDVIGLDFAQRALRTLRTRQPGLKLAVGDVSNIPFPDRTFDLYYSGGVVEHFESGAEPSLHEARRVLKDNGTLLISVPYFSPLRRMLAPLKKGEWRRVDRPESEAGEGSLRRFFQYAYRSGTFQQMLRDAGLKTIRTQGYAVLWGIRELKLSGSGTISELPARRDPGQRKEPAYVDISDLVRDRESSLIRRLVISEDHTVPVLGFGVRFMRWFASNMMMYVCRRA